jgi:hypothetical protein
MIQIWIERIPPAMDEVIRLNSRNEYMKSQQRRDCRRRGDMASLDKNLSFCRDLCGKVQIFVRPTFVCHVPTKHSFLQIP